MFLQELIIIFLPSLYIYVSEKFNPRMQISVTKMNNDVFLFKISGW